MSDFFSESSGDFPKAEPIERGCGKRKAGGVYVECGLVPPGYGRPFTDFLLDPPQPPPEGVDLVNKVQTWQDAARVHHLLVWIGAEHYPYLPDFIEEARRFGISRRIRGNFDFSVLTPASRMLLIHPAAINPSWQFQAPPALCPKNIAAHLASPPFSDADADEDEEAGEDEDDKATAEAAHEEAMDMYAGGKAEEKLAVAECVGKLWELIPESAAERLLSREEVSAIIKDEQPNLAIRKLPSFEYLFTPASGIEGALLGEFALEPGIFGIFPITGFALIERDDGTINDIARAKIEQAGLNFYQAQA